MQSGHRIGEVQLAVVVAVGGVGATGGRTGEKEYLVQLHADRSGDLKAMAAALGITVRALYDRFRRLGLRPKDLG